MSGLVPTMSAMDLVEQEGFSIERPLQHGNKSKYSLLNKSNIIIFNDFFSTLIIEEHASADDARLARKAQKAASQRRISEQCKEKKTN